MYDNPFGIVKTFVAICSQSDTIKYIYTYSESFRIIGEHPHEIDG